VVRLTFLEPFGQDLGQLGPGGRLVTDRACCSGKADSENFSYITGRPRHLLHLQLPDLPGPRRRPAPPGPACCTGPRRPPNPPGAQAPVQAARARLPLIAARRVLIALGAPPHRDSGPDVPDLPRRAAKVLLSQPCDGRVIRPHLTQPSGTYPAPAAAAAAPATPGQAPTTANSPQRPGRPEPAHMGARSRLISCLATRPESAGARHYHPSITDCSWRCPRLGGRYPPICAASGSYPAEAH
jgi:hypothetical protein